MRKGKTSLRIFVIAAIAGGFVTAAAAQPPAKIGPLAAQRAKRTTGWSRVIITAAEGRTQQDVENAIGGAGGVKRRSLPMIDGHVAWVPNAALSDLANSTDVADIAL